MKKIFFILLFTTIWSCDEKPANDYKQINNVNESFNIVSNGGLMRSHNTPNFPTKTNSQPGGVLAGFYGKLHQRHQSTVYDPFVDGYDTNSQVKMELSIYICFLSRNPFI